MEKNYNKEYAERIYKQMNDNEKYGVKFGLFPYWISKILPRGVEFRQVALYLMEMAKNDDKDK